MRNPPDPKTFRQIMGQYATGVTVVTATGADGNPVGLTANSVTSVSLTPPLVLVCLSRESESLERIMESGGFAVNVLGSEQHDIASRFAGKDRSSRWEGVEHHLLESGRPILNEVLAWLDCTIFERFEVGDHVILVGEAVAGDIAGGDPLLFFGGQYGRLRS